MITVGQMSQDWTTNIRAMHVKIVRMAEQGNHTDTGPFVGKRANQKLKTKITENAGAENPTGGLQGEARPQSENGEEGDEHAVEKRGRADGKEEQRRPLDDAEEVSTLLVVKDVIADIYQRQGKDAEAETGYANEPREASRSFR